jgi:beta-phosphoglucomutase family hydrolase
LSCKEKSVRQSFSAATILEASMSPQASLFNPAKFDAVIFDLDGVLTQTAKLHARCWKQAFDEFLQQRADKSDATFKPFDLQDDYANYVDGKPRNDGVQSFLQSRNLDLPFGDPDDPPDKETICGLGNRKNKLFEEALKANGVEVYQGSVTWIRKLREAGIKTAVVSASKHCRMVLAAAGLTDLFEARVDGKVAEELNLKGKPAPDTYLKAAEMLNIQPGRTVVVEDALAGVQAGRQGGFGLVIGVDRKGDADELRKNGAGLVVKDLGEMVARM